MDHPEEQGLQQHPGSTVLSDQIRTIARRERVSVAEIVRRCVTRFLQQESPDRGELFARAASLIGKFPDPDAATDLAENHDEYLADAYR